MFFSQDSGMVEGAVTLRLEIYLSNGRYILDSAV